jgi:acyl-CoA synthetase (NDP forming)
MIGATGGDRDVWSYNARMTRSLLASSFDEVVLVSRREKMVLGRRAYEHISEVRGGPGDLCVVVVPHSVLAQTVADCANSGWSRVLAITGQLNSVDREALRSIVPGQVRLWGPNCTGFIATKSNRRVMSSDYRPAHRPGRRQLAVVGQSGGALGNIAGMGERFGLSISHIMSSGEEIDVGFEDMLGYLAYARATDTVIAFVEQARRPEAFLAALDDCVAAAISVIVIKVGRSAPARIAAATHSGAMVGDADEFDAAVAAHGGIVCSSFREAAGVATVATHSRHRRPGRRTAFFTSSGGTGVLACDLAERHNLSLAQLAEPGATKVRELVPGGIDDVNPFDSALGGGTPSSLRTYLDALGADPGVDVLVVLHGGDVYGEFVTQQLENWNPSQTTVLAVWPNIADAWHDRLLHVGVPVFEDPEDTCRWLDLAAEPWDPSAILPSGSPPGRAEGSGDGSVDAGSPSSPGSLSYRSASQLLRRSLLTVPQQWYVDGRDEIEGVVKTVHGYPVVVKAADLSGHKAIHGGVLIGVQSAEELRAVLEQMIRSFGPVVVEEEAPNGVEVMVAVHDGPFGGIALVGLGGPYAERFGKQVVVMAGTDSKTLERAIGRSSVASVLGATLGDDALPSALRAVADAVSGLALLLRAEGLSQIEINPLIVSSKLAVACDVKVEVRNQTSAPAEDTAPANKATTRSSRGHASPGRLPAPPWSR